MEHGHDSSSVSGARPGVQVEEVSPEYLRVTIDGVVFDVGVERVFTTCALFGGYRSLDELIDVLTLVRQRTPRELLEMPMDGPDGGGGSGDGSHEDSHRSGGAEGVEHGHEVHDQ